MVTRLKICGITNLQDACAVVRTGVHILGFNFFPGSSRYLSFSDARNIIRRLPFDVAKVGILVRPFWQDILEAIEKSSVNVVQLYEPQDLDGFSEVPVPVIQAVRIGEGRELNFFPDANMILVDSFSRNKYGGSGKSFAWNKIPPQIPKEKLILAGGLNPENISDAMRLVHPAVIDIASGAESSPGHKNITKIKSLVEQINKFNHGNSTDGI